MLNSFQTCTGSRRPSPAPPVYHSAALGKNKPSPWSVERSPPTKAVAAAPPLPPSVLVIPSYRCIFGSYFEAQSRWQLLIKTKLAFPRKAFKNTHTHSTIALCCFSCKKEKPKPLDLDLPFCNPGKLRGGGEKNFKCTESRRRGL